MQQELLRHLDVFQTRWLARPWGRYLLAVVLTALAWLFRWSMPSVLASAPYLAFYPACVLAAAFGGLGPGVVATVGSFLCVDLFFDETPGWIEFRDPAVLMQMGIFIACGTGISVLAELMRAAQAAQRRRTRDLSEALENLKRTERRYRSFVEVTNQFAWVTDAAGRVVEDVPALRQFTGQTYEQVRDAGWAQAVHPDDVQRTLEVWNKAVATDSAYETEYRMRRHDGVYRLLLARGVPIRADDGSVREWVGTCIDITDRKTAEARLALQAAALEAAANGIAITDADGIILWANRAFVELTGYSVEEVLGQSHRILKSGAQDEPFYRDLWDTVRRGDVWRGELINRRKNGELYSEEQTITPLRDPQGRITHFIAIKQDISTRKTVERALAAAQVSADRAKAAAELANRTKDHFLAVLSHELRTPLTPVVMGVSMLQARDDLDPAVRQTLEMVRRNVEIEARLIDDLLDLTRIARGKVELQKQHVELCSIVQHAIDVCRPDIDARGLHFHIDRPPDAPYWVEADPARLQQVFWNLLKNSIKFTPQGGRVSLRCIPENKHVVVEVTDSGIGIDPQAMPRIFDAFEQAQRSITRQFGGLGLGLAISKALVEMHHGTIEARSEGPGKGATFRIRLPLAAGNVPSESPAPAMPVAHAAVPPLRILLVEDHDASARIVQMVLGTEGHSVQTAPDLAAALAAAQKQRFDLLISDLGLPDGSGHELLHQLRSRGYQFPAIAMTGYGQDEDIRRSYTTGFAAHLTKPASRERLIEVIASVMNRHPISAEPTSPGSNAEPGPPSQSEPPPPVFDRNEAIRRCAGEPELFEEMVGYFFNETDTLIDELRAALASADAEAIARIAHRFKGTVGYLGAKPATDATQAVEQMGLSGDLSSADRLLDELARQVQWLKRELEPHHLVPSRQK